MKPIKCKVYCNGRWGYVASPIEFPSINKAVDYARRSCWFAYRVYNMDGKLVRRGFCK